MVLDENGEKSADEINKLFMVPGIEDKLLSLIDDCLVGKEEAISNKISTFKDTILSIASVVSIPYQIADHSIHSRDLDKLIIAQRIRNRKYEIKNGDKEKEDEIIDLSIREARENYEQLMCTDEGLNQHIVETQRFLSSLSRQQLTEKNELHESFSDLLLQGVVLIWSAFEVTVRDLLLGYLNTNPEKVVLLSSDTELRKIFNLGKIDLQVIQEYNFELKNNLGEIYFGKIDFSNIKLVRLLLKHLVAKKSLLSEIDSTEMWEFSQLRHLIVHNRGYVDKRYKAITSCNLNVGDRVLIRPVQK
ncbi:hypothetical protein [Marispirochaeta aestuarii]|uniref:hypothetical protein n=1 Tax=Marispirochaeta aestuarii TaxID=1963862 RepID=UPI0029C77505|nr:hypothetical protein [Marispirochaeta aestuarii]